MIRAAIVGVGNCASALIQGVAVAQGDGALTGVTYKSVGGYAPKDVTFVAGFDVDARKVGKTLAEAIFAPPNCCYRIAKSAQSLACLPTTRVLSAPVMDGVAAHMLEQPAHTSFRITEEPALDRDAILAALAEARVDVLVNYLPVGSQAATEFWAQVCLDANIAFCNCIPVFIASDPVWEAKFIAKGLPLIGDDMKSLFGASVLSQMLQELAFDRGHAVKAHIQQNVGGNTDFLNMCDKTRLKSKKISKENVIRCVRGAALRCPHACSRRPPSYNPIVQFHPHLLLQVSKRHPRRAC